MTVRSRWKHCNTGNPTAGKPGRSRRWGIKSVAFMLLFGGSLSGLLLLNPLLNPPGIAAASVGASSVAASSVAQLPIPSPSASLDGAKPPAGVERYGDIEVTPVTFNGENLFKVVAPTVRDRKNPGNQTPVEVRADAIEANLRRVIADEQSEVRRNKRGYSTAFDPDSFQTNITTVGGQTMIVATDDYRSNPLELVAVTEKDANYYGVSVAELAEQWQATLQRKLAQELTDRAPERFEKNLAISVAIAVATLVGSVILFAVQQLLAGRDHQLKQRQTHQVEAAIAAEQATAESTANPPVADATADPDTTDAAQTALAQSSLSSATAKPTLFPQGSILNALRRQFTLTRRRRILAAFRWLVGWAQIMIWLVGLGFILQQFPSTRQIGVSLLEVPIYLLLVWFVVGLMNWVGDVLIDRAARIWEDDQFSRFPLFAIEDAQRKSLRISTTINALRGLKTFVLGVFGIGLALQSLGVPIASVLAGGAIIAFGITLAFQNLLKDLINGCLILWEDQYGIGDVVAIDGTSGLVENMNLRITQLRDAEGRLITIPNSTITKVENLTRTWSRVNLDIEIDYDADVDQVLSVIQAMAQAMYHEAEWRDRILEPPDILGVDHLSHTGILIRIWIKTKPLQQWPVGREFRRRLHRALAEHHIHIGVPRQALQAETDNFMIANSNWGDREASSDGQKQPQ